MPFKIRIEKEGVPVGVPLPTFLLTHGVRSSTFSTSEYLLFILRIL